jgi:hypothetical protein
MGFTVIQILFSLIVFDRFARLWNNHLIRPSTNGESPSGRPDVLYYLPEVSSTHNYLVPVENDDITLSEQLCDSTSPSFNCSAEFLKLAQIIMSEENLLMPRTPVDARGLYLSLIHHIDNL